MRAGVHGGAALAAALPLAILCALAPPARADERHCRDCDDIPFQWDDGASQPPAVGPFPQGFALTVAITPGLVSPQPGPARLDRYVEVGSALGRCLSGGLAPGDARWADLTIRVSFRRDGAVNGLARVVHVSDPADSDAQRRGSDRVLAALTRCTPLPFTPSLGRALAGQIFAIRFVQQRNS